jgi:hypothetical protein
MTEVDHIRGETFHGRKGGVSNSFKYGVDYLLLDPETAKGPWLFGRNRASLTSLHDVDHGGEPKRGRGVVWVREVLAAHGVAGSERILLLAQPRVLGHVFNPVSFWLCHDEAGELRSVIAEVSNTYGDRHSYLCHRADHAPIGREDVLSATKIFYVSPFQPVEGGYTFRFDIRADRIGIWIDYSAGAGGLYATLTGPRVPLSNWGIVRACLRRPFGSRRVLALIHWQALKLAIKGAKFRSRPVPPVEEVSK